MRIHYLINGLNGGGAAFPIPDLVALMRAQGHSVKLIALMPQDRKSCARLDAAGIDWQLIGSGPRDLVPAAARLLRLLRDDRPDLIWTSLTRATLFGQIAGRLRGIPVVSWQHNAFLKPWNLRLLRRTKALSAYWVADSQTVAEFAEQQLGVSPELIDVWPLFRARAEVPLAGICEPGRRFRIGTLGRLHPNKNHRHLIEAAVRVRAQWPELAARLEFVIGGDGPLYETLGAQIAEAGLDNVHLAGFIDQPETFLAGLHAYLQPSHHEGLCIAAHEAMQAALPVIATKVGELRRSVLPGVTGYLCEVGDAAAMAAAVVELADDRARAARMGAASRERVLSRFGEAEFRRAGIAVLARAARLVEDAGRR
ncbi:MAG: glycosyltransferase [Nevskia sp.]